jgi:hypothetical protein
MKQIYSCIFILLFTVTTCSAEGAIFDYSRNVLVIQPVRHDAIGTYVYNRTTEPFKIPYYELLPSIPPINDVRPAVLASLALAYNADIVLVPVVISWHQWYSNPINGEYDAPFIETSYQFRIYAYNRTMKSFNHYDVYYHEKEEASSLNATLPLMRKGMNTLIEKLPYKRIPTDIARPNFNTIPTRQSTKHV